MVGWTDSLRIAFDDSTRLMPRQPLACRRAVKSLSSAPQSVWVTDELLASTFQRFFRISCPQQKRHGSHVPGPLEARRRATKRRMTVSAGFCPQDSFPSSLNLRAWFGFRENAQPLWRYEPPSYQAESIAPNDFMSAKATLKSTTSSSGRNAKCTNVTAECNSSHELVPSELPIARPVALPHNIPAEEATPTVQMNVEVQDDVDIQACFDLFKLQALEDGLLTAYHSCCPHGTNAWLFNIQVLDYMVQTKQNPTAFLESFTNFPFAVPPAYSHRSLTFLHLLNKCSSIFPESREQVLSVYTHIAISATYARNATSFIEDTILLRTMQRLWSYAQPLRTEGGILIESVQAIAQKLSICAMEQELAPAQTGGSRLELHLQRLLRYVCKDSTNSPIIDIVASSVPREAFAQIVPRLTIRLATAPKPTRSTRKYSSAKVLHIWFSLLRRMDCSSTSWTRTLQMSATNSLSQAVFARGITVKPRLSQLLHLLLVASVSRGAATELAEEDIERLLRPSMARGFQDRDTVVDVVDILFERLQRAGHSTHDFANDILNAYALYAGPNPTFRLLNIISRRNVALQSLEATTQVIKNQVLSVFSTTSAQQRTQVLHTYQLISEKLRTHANTSTTSLACVISEAQARHRFQQVIRRARTDGALPLSVNNINADVSDETKIRLIHQIAHVYSTNTNINQRQSQRAVYQLYRYMVDQKFAIGPLFSKAVTRCSISRPMSENHFVSSRRLAWVCNLVAAVEGEYVARKVENVFWTWRGEIILHAKRTHIAAGGRPHVKVSVSKLKKLGMI